MTILAITPYTGSEKLVKMTEAMLASFHDIVTAGLAGFDPRIEVAVVAVNNAASREQTFPVTWHCHMGENVGFGRAINMAIEREIIEPPKLKTVHVGTGKTTKTPQDVNITDILLLNNDLQFPDTNWLAHLLRERDGQHVLSPCTDVTATKQAVAPLALNLEPIMHREVSAFCWLVPVAHVHALRKKFGFNLFHPDFSNYGSDDVTAACLRSIVGPKPFKIVPRSWVKHLKAQTANELGVKAGNRELIGRIVNFKRAKRLT
jgi:hypothetical protein